MATKVQKIMTQCVAGPPQANAGAASLGGQGLRRALLFYTRMQLDSFVVLTARLLCGAISVHTHCLHVCHAGPST
jgi:hypothetical protein